MDKYVTWEMLGKVVNKAWGHEAEIAEGHMRLGFLWAAIEEVTTNKPTIRSEAKRARGLFSRVDRKHSEEVREAISILRWIEEHADD